MESHSSSSSSSSYYDVFLSFRGEDTRFGFAAHLYDALEKNGVDAFFDDYKIRVGESISPTLKKAIDESRSSIVILSKNYANSSWCLEELAMVLECRKTMGQLVFPIFYGVDPSDVRKQEGSFGEALVEHEKDLKPDMVDKVKKWREALTEVGNLSGWDSRNKSEPTLIKEIVIDVLKQLSESYSQLSESSSQLSESSSTDVISTCLVKKDLCVPSESSTQLSDSSSTHVIPACLVNKDSSCVPSEVIPSPLATTVNIGANYGAISGSYHSNPFKNLKHKCSSKLEDVKGNTVEFVTDMLDKAENFDLDELKFKFKRSKENLDLDELKFMFKRSMCKVFHK